MLRCLRQLGDALVRAIPRYLVFSLADTMSSLARIARGTAAEGTWRKYCNNIVGREKSYNHHT
jgi:hypothetical protein